MTQSKAQEGICGEVKLCLLLSAGRFPANSEAAPAQLRKQPQRHNLELPKQATRSTVMAEETTTAPTVDTTPISPIRDVPERRNSLEKHLQHRPDQQDLKNRHILLDTTAAPYVRISLELPGPFLSPTGRLREGACTGGLLTTACPQSSAGQTARARAPEDHRQPEERSRA